jgi:hypothetical protein
MTIAEAIQKLGPKPANGLLLGEVISIQGILVEVQPLDGSAAILDARLACSDGDGILVTPKIGSLVACSDGDIPVVVLFSEITSFKVKIQGQEMTLDNQALQLNGFLSIQSQNASLKNCIDELIDFILQIQVFNPIIGNSTLLPALAPQLLALKSKFATFIK